MRTSVVLVTGAGTDHFANAGKPADQATSAAYAAYDGLMDRIGARLSIGIADLLRPSLWAVD